MWSIIRVCFEERCFEIAWPVCLDCWTPLEVSGGS